MNAADFAREPRTAPVIVLFGESLVAAINHLLLFGLIRGGALSVVGGLIGRAVP